MGATWTFPKTWIAGEVLTASDLNTQFITVTSNFIPAGMDDYSTSVTEMRTQTDPYPGSSENLATDLSGEVARVRYQLAQILNKTYWYQDADSIQALKIYDGSAYRSASATPTANTVPVSGSDNLLVRGWLPEFSNAKVFSKIPQVVTITIASPAVVSGTTHTFVAGDAVVFSTTGALPTGITSGTTYYVIPAGLTADAFEISTTVNGSAVNTSGTQSGVHTVKPVWVTESNISKAVILAVAGGGGGGGGKSSTGSGAVGGGGGSAGGARFVRVSPAVSTSYTVTVGTGGTGGAGTTGNVASNPGSDGTLTSVGALVSNPIVGKGGGVSASATAGAVPSGEGTAGIGRVSGTSGSVGESFGRGAGGNGGTAPGDGDSGGGGAGGDSLTATGGNGGNGGVLGTPATSGTAGTFGSGGGGGGGGSDNTSGDGGNGGSGLVVIWWW